MNTLQYSAMPSYCEYLISICIEPFIEEKFTQMGKYFRSIGVQNGLLDIFNSLENQDTYIDLIIQ